MLILVNIVLVITAASGTYLIAHHNKKGFLVFLLLEFCSLYIGLKSGNYGVCVAAVLYLYMNVYSYIKWAKAEKKYEIRK